MFRPPGPSSGCVKDVSKINYTFGFTRGGFILKGKGKGGGGRANIMLYDNTTGMTYPKKK
jgi:hypothetical protein